VPVGVSAKFRAPHVCECQHLLSLHTICLSLPALLLSFLHYACSMCVETKPRKHDFHVGLPNRWSKYAATTVVATETMAHVVKIIICSGEPCGKKEVLRYCSICSGTTSLEKFWMASAT